MSTEGVKDLLSDGAETAPVSKDSKVETKEVSEKPTTSKEEVKTDSKDEIPDLLSDDEKKEEVKSEAPEKYEFKLPEGKTINKEELDAFSGLAKELNMSQEKAQKLVEWELSRIDNAVSKNEEAIMNNYKQIQQEEYNKSVEHFTKEGNGDLKEGMKYVAAFKNKFLDSDTKEYLKTTGQVNNFQLLKLFDKLGRMVSEDNFVDGKNNTKPTISDGELFYGKQK